MTSTEDIESGHQDRVTVVHINFDGSRILTASIDHKVKVWTVDRATGARQLLESFTAHDADIRDAKWLHPSTGSHIATVGNDLKCHLWQEEPLQAPRSGRRFRKIFTIASEPRVPFVSLDVKNVDSIYTSLALIDRQGLLSVYEPTNPDDFKDWSLVDRFNVCIPSPGRNEQTCFKVRFDPNIIPLPYINCVSDDRRQLGLVVTAMNEVKIYRSVAPDTSHASAGEHARDLHTNADEASRRIVFYEAAKLPVHPAMVRDVQWAPFNVRGNDLFATACKDGAVRIFELQVLEHTESTRSAVDRSADHASQTHGSRTPAGNSNLRPQPVQQSSLTSAITLRNQASNSAATGANPAQHGSDLQNQSQGGVTNQYQHHQQQQQQQQPQTQQLSTMTSGPATTAATTTTSLSIITQNRNNRTTHKFPYKHIITTQANLSSAHTDAWSVHWDPSGQVLISGGDDGVTKIWRRGVLDAHHQYNQQQQQQQRGAGAGAGAGAGGAKVHDQQQHENETSGAASTTTQGLTLQQQQQQNHGGITAAGSTEGQPFSSAGGGGRWMLFADQAVEFSSVGSGGGNGDGNNNNNNNNNGGSGGDNNNNNNNNNNNDSDQSSDAE